MHFLTMFALLDKHAPYKHKKIRANQVPYITKYLKQLIHGQINLIKLI